jgi:hypothetical protein
VVRVAQASPSKLLDRKPLSQARTRHGQVLARATPKAKSKMLVSAIDAKSLTKSRRKPAADPKMHDTRKASRTAEGHRETPRHRPHVA